MNNEERTNVMEQLIARASMDDGFRRNLVSDPAAALEDIGLKVPSGYEVRVMENTGNIFHLVLPQKPTSDELSDEALAEISAGLCMSFVKKVGGAIGDAAGAVGGAINKVGGVIGDALDSHGKWLAFGLLGLAGVLVGTGHASAQRCVDGICTPIEP